MDPAIDPTTDAGAAATAPEEQPSECAFCGTPLHSSYFLLDAAPACEACRYRLEQEHQARPATAGFLRASAAGFGAAVASSVLYYAVTTLAEHEFALLAIVVGLMVGSAVRWGSRGRGGRAFQALAVFLTYMAIVTSYLPLVFQQMSETGEETVATEQTPVAPAASGAKTPDRAAAKEMPTLGQFILAVLALLAFAAALPFLAGAENLVGLLIIAIGLWQAWKLNQRKELDITGPFTAGRPTVPATPA
jgi:hypothetical protein